MNTRHTLDHPITMTTHLLANIAGWWGFLLTPLYTILFGLIVTDPRGTLAGMVLPPGPPLVGLLLVLPAGIEHHPATRPAALVGLALNAIPAVLALLLWWIP